MKFKPQPSDKSPALSSFIDDMAFAMFGRSRTDAIAAEECVMCGEAATTFNDPRSEKEYTISGSCQACQDSIFDI